MLKYNKRLLQSPEDDIFPVKITKFLNMTLKEVCFLKTYPFRPSCSSFSLSFTLSWMFQLKWYFSFCHQFFSWNCHRYSVIYFLPMNQYNFSTFLFFVFYSLVASSKLCKFSKNLFKTCSNLLEIVLLLFALYAFIDFVKILLLSCY